MNLKRRVLASLISKAGNEPTIWLAPPPSLYPQTCSKVAIIVSIHCVYLSLLGVGLSTLFSFGSIVARGPEVNSWLLPPACCQLGTVTNWVRNLCVEGKRISHRSGCKLILKQRASYFSSFAIFQRRCPLITGGSPQNNNNC